MVYDWAYVSTKKKKERKKERKKEHRTTKCAEDIISSCILYDLDTYETISAVII